MRNRFYIVGIIFVILTIFSFKANAQLSPFHRIPHPNELKIQKKYTLSVTDSFAVIIPSIVAFRFTAPMAGYDIINNQVVTGVGFGWNKLHYIDSLSKWYSDISINAVAFAGGSAIPSAVQNNIISVGLGIGIKNNLIMITPCYNLPLIAGTKGKFGLVATINMALN